MSGFTQSLRSTGRCDPARSSRRISSSLDLEGLARHVRRPRSSSACAFHPTHEMRLMEIAKCERTAEDAIATIVVLASAMNRIPVVGSIS